ncbi:kinase-like protein [Sphaerulina musiva SO2202]|uniref:Kinase-like protein n=1 Tax=Sphaerulina musiva (strain SO2202) TaxID=692275 RepID=M3CEY3_SPHMS|nr:kinase-like protein [Sphaerulina musiva SO2202]EMF11596.1 kinase-like protein [Sphaerulina musiva SO2202]
MLSASSNHVTEESITGASGRVYRIEKILQDKGHPLTKVYRAKSDGMTNDFVLKEISQEWDVRLGIYERIGNNCPYLRNLVDTIPERQMFVFEYLEDNLLLLARQEDEQPPVPPSAMKYILKCILKGLAELHSKDIIHNDIKANNIMIQFSSRAPEWKVAKVQLVDLEDAHYTPPPAALGGAWVGNIMWRSPEAHAMGPIRKSSDMWSFGLVCLYAITRVLPFAVDKASLPKDVEPLAIIISRQISYFVEADDFCAFINYLEPDSPWVQAFMETLKEFTKGGKPFKPFRMWKHYERFGQPESLRGLIGEMVRFDPDKRLTAEEALGHEWFREGEGG